MSKLYEKSAKIVKMTPWSFHIIAQKISKQDNDLPIMMVIRLHLQISQLNNSGGEESLTNTNILLF